MPVVLCYGDSNTHGTPPVGGPGAVDRYDTATRWPRVLAAALGPGWEVIEEGLPGRTTVHPDPIEGAEKNGLAVLPAILHSHRPVDLVVLMLGTNDLKARFSVTAADVGHACAGLLREIVRSGAGPGGAAPACLLVCPPPLTEVDWLGDIFTGGAEKSRALPHALAEAARAEGAAFFDAGTVIASDPRDGIHFSQDSHRRLGAALAPAVRAALEGQGGAA